MAAIRFNLGEIANSIDYEKDLIDIVFSLEKTIREGRTFPQIRLKDILIKDK
jgi:hypothetical protein